MAHFAWLDKNNVVYQVSVVNNSDLLDENGKESEEKGIAYLTTVHGSGHKWVQTSYNNNFRGKYAGIGDRWDSENEEFITPQPAPE